MLFGNWPSHSKPVLCLGSFGGLVPPEFKTWSSMTFGGARCVYLKRNTEDKSITALCYIYWNINQMMDLVRLCSVDPILIVLLPHHQKCGPPPFLLTIFLLVCDCAMSVRQLQKLLTWESVKMTVFVVSNWKYWISTVWPVSFPWSTHGNAATLALWEAVLS